MDEKLIARILREAQQHTEAALAVGGMIPAGSRQLEEVVLALAAARLSTTDIARRLGCSPAVIQPALDAAISQRPRGQRREERFPYELHVIWASKLHDHPELRDLARANIRRMRESPRAPFAEGWLDRWETILDMSVDDMDREMLKDDEQGIDMRQISPFAGALDQEEREIALKKAQFLAGGLAGSGELTGSDPLGGFSVRLRLSK
ncbi:hypothetical protein [Pseudarthrobacter siccitolerans]